MIIRNLEETYCVNIAAENIKSMVEKIESLGEIVNLRNISFLEIFTNDNEIKQVCKTEGIKISYRQTNVCDVCVKFDLLIDDSILKELCDCNEICFDSTIKEIDNSKRNSIEEEKICKIILADFYEELYKDSYYALGEILEEFEKNFIDYIEE